MFDFNFSVGFDFWWMVVLFVMVLVNRIKKGILIEDGKRLFFCNFLEKF